MGGERREIELKNDLEELERLGNWLTEWAEHESLNPKTLFQLNLVCDELVTNTILYGCTTDAAHTIWISLLADSETIELTIKDDGLAFDPFARPSPDVTLPLEEREIGGLGIHFVREVMDEAFYVREGSFNTICMKKTGWKSPQED
ncbi:ATP-binding protein [Paenibacillus agricola]|uniref:ATP-binding protein n=1 Tax=Paenibacillus agricola TaxID=2716264 RepID=A0ABX0JAV1_9BACL|nr:ATP-binding protein [Paenibacillus agricola]NHN32401.1 ATP-binding protein [Paenibacillus agricola]